MTKKLKKLNDEIVSILEKYSDNIIYTLINNSAKNKTDLTYVIHSSNGTRLLKVTRSLSVYFFNEGIVNVFDSRYQKDIIENSLWFDCNTIEEIKDHIADWIDEEDFVLTPEKKMYKDSHYNALAFAASFNPELLYDDNDDDIWLSLFYTSFHSYLAGAGEEA